VMVVLFASNTISLAERTSEALAIVSERIK
jgi:hypothetical protein